MDDGTLYKDPSRIIYDLMKSTFQDNFTYFLGSPTEIPEAAYPVLIVQPGKSRITVNNASTGSDRVSEQISIELFYNRKDDANAPNDKDTTMRRIYNIVQGRDPTNGKWVANTILNVLRTNLTLGTTIIDQDIDVDYAVQPRVDMDTILMAIITIVIDEQVQVPNRV